MLLDDSKLDQPAEIPTFSSPPRFPVPTTDAEEQSTSTYVQSRGPGFTVPEFNLSSPLPTSEKQFVSRDEQNLPSRVPSSRSTQRLQKPVNTSPSQPWFNADEIVNYTIQIIGVIAAIVFGAWAIKSFDAAQEANRISTNSYNAAQTANGLSAQAMQQSLIANQLSLLVFCLSANLTSDSSQACSEFSADMMLSIPSIVAALSPSDSTPIPEPVSGRPGPAPLSFGAIIGIIVGVVIPTSLVGLISIAKRRKKMV